MSGDLAPGAARCGASRRPSPRSPSATWAPTPASTPASRSRLGDVGRTWEVRAARASAARCGRRRCASRTWSSAPTPRPGSRCARAGSRASTPSPSGASTRAANLDLALGFEGLFRLPDGRPPLLRMHRGRRPATARISTLIAGRRARAGGLPARPRVEQDLASSRRSRRSPRSYTVHAIDLPGLRLLVEAGPRAPTTPPTSPARCSRFMDAMGIERAHLVGNSMGGRVAIELGARRSPSASSSLSLLAPGARLAAPPRAGAAGEAAAPRAGGDPAHAAATRSSASSSGACSRARSASTPRPPTSPPTSSAAPTARASARIAFFAAARNIYLEEPDGERGFWTRLPSSRRRRCSSGATSDRLVPAALLPPRRARRCPTRARWCSSECGHVPQVELPERTNALVRDFIGRAQALGRRARRAAARAGPRAPAGRIESPAMADQATLAEQAKRNGGERRGRRTARLRDRLASLARRCARAGGGLAARGGAGARGRRSAASPAAAARSSAAG